MTTLSELWNYALVESRRTHNPAVKKLCKMILGIDLSTKEERKLYLQHIRSLERQVSDLQARKPRGRPKGSGMKPAARKAHRRAYMREWRRRRKLEDESDGLS
jgi:hypothetical protein